MTTGYFRDYLILGIAGMLIAMIPLALAPQSQVLASIFVTILLFVWFLLIFVLGIPHLRNELIEITNSTQILGILLANLLAPYIGLLLFGLPFFDTIGIYFLWYIIPTILLTIVLLKINQVADEIRVILTVGAALLFWIGFDHRYTLELFDVFEDVSYIMSGFWIASLMMIGYGYSCGVHYSHKFFSEKAKEEQIYGLQPTAQGLKIAQYAALTASIVIIPIGLTTGFLDWNPSWPGIIDVVVAFLGIFLTISLQEELVFRGIVLNEVDRYALPRGLHRYLTLFLVSLAFGITHWNNEVVKYVPHYIILATVAGIAYGWAYRKSGMFGAMLTHTLIDWIWRLFLQRA